MRLCVYTPNHNIVILKHTNLNFFLMNIYNIFFYKFCIKKIKFFFVFFVGCKVIESEVGPRVFLTAPLSLEEESDVADYRAPNLLQRILSLFSSVRPGSDLTRIQVKFLF